MGLHFAGGKHSAPIRLPSWSLQLALVICSFDTILENSIPAFTYPRHHLNHGQNLRWSRTQRHEIAYSEQCVDIDFSIVRGNGRISGISRGSRLLLVVLYGFYNHALNVRRDLLGITSFAPRIF